MVDKMGAPISRPGEPRPPEQTQAGSRTAGSGPSFADALQARELRFSAHAQQRLRARDIALTSEDHASLAKAVEIAGAKGAQESLILIDDLALIVSVRDRVVITALERGSDQTKVFTNIDSAVVLPRNHVNGLA
jgi:flagellar operon protein